MNDPFPGDTVAPPPNLWSVAGYVFERQQSGLYRQGDERSDVTLHTWIGALRATYSFQVAGFTVAPTVAFSYAAGHADQPLQPTGQTSAEGVGDLRLATQVWLVNEPSLRRYIALTGLVIAPTGQYERRDLLSIGENRWRYVVSVGWNEGLGERWDLEVVPEATLSGFNRHYLDRYTLDQDPAYALTGYLRYQVSDALLLSVGAQINTGGQTRLDGAAQDDRGRSTRVLAGVAYTFTPMLRANLRVGHDLAIENGFKTRRELALRVTKVF